MVKSCFYCHIPLILAIGSMLFTANGINLCSDNLGPCHGGNANQCDSRCLSIHRQGKGGCTKDTGMCICYYLCSPPPNRKQCTGAIDLCSMRCGDSCCEQRCAQKYSGRNGHGTCFDPIGNIRSCLCTYNCPS